MEYLSPSRRLRIPKKKFTIEQKRGKRPALSQSHRPPAHFLFVSPHYLEHKEENCCPKQGVYLRNFLS